MLDFDDLKDGINEFKENNPLGFKIASLLVILFFISLIVFFVQRGPETIRINENEEFLPDQPITVPDSPDVEKDYFESRIKEKEWTENEIMNYFTAPEGSQSMSNLENENDNIVKNILESSL